MVESSFTDSPSGHSRPKSAGSPSWVLPGAAASAGGGASTPKGVVSTIGSADACTGAGLAGLDALVGSAGVVAGCAPCSSSSGSTSWWRSCGFVGAEFVDAVERHAVEAGTDLEPHAAADRIGLREDVPDDEFPVVLAFGVLLQLRVFDLESTEVRGEAANRERLFLPRMVRSVKRPGTTMGATDFSEADGGAMMVLLMMNDGSPTAPGG